MKTQKCCAHCPGKLVPPGSNESHECCQPRYVSGNLRTSSLNKHVSDYSRKEDSDKEDLLKPLPENRLTCYDQFAIAKKLHAENLEHQPLPDKVDDSVFKNATSKGCCCGHSSRKCDRCKQAVEGHSLSLNKRFGPALGCKEPKTMMDLAICWETPVDPVYEPPRPTHIDGSEGGLAPAIFTLVQHTSSSRASLRSGALRDEKASCERCKSREDLNRSENENKEKDNKSVQCCCDCLCKGLNGVKISRKNQVEARSRRGSFRKCVACETKNAIEDPRLIRSAVGLALGTEKPESDQRRGGNKATVPRPKTPFARRSFCIDTLSPPFSVVNGCRDVDFPEHWRLMSVYQQSYKNPHRRRIYRC